MIRTLTAAVVAALVSISPVAAAKYETPSPSVVRLQKANGGGCTAVHIGDGLFLSARHCYSEMNYPNNYELTVNDAPVYVAWAHKALDVIMLKVPTLTDMPAAEVACRKPELNEPVVAEGMNSVWGWLRTEGAVIGITTEYEENPHDFVHSASVVNGMSGGPLWDADGKLLGINNAFVTENPSMSLATPLVIVCSSIPGTEAHEERMENKKK